MNISHNRRTLVELSRRLDMKEASVNRYNVWNTNGTPCDALGVWMHEQGEVYQKDDGSGRLLKGRNPTRRLADMLGVELYDIREMYKEIDRPESTNKTIQRKIRDIFDAAPSPE